MLSPSTIVQQMMALQVALLKVIKRTIVYSLMAPSPATFTKPKRMTAIYHLRTVLGISRTIHATGRVMLSLNSIIMVFHWKMPYIPTDSCQIFGMQPTQRNRMSSSPLNIADLFTCNLLPPPSPTAARVVATPCGLAMVRKITSELTSWLTCELSSHQYILVTMMYVLITNEGSSHVAPAEGYA